MMFSIQNVVCDTCWNCLKKGEKVWVNGEDIQQ